MIAIVPAGPSLWGGVSLPEAELDVPENPTYYDATHGAAGGGGAGAGAGAGAGPAGAQAPELVKLDL